MKLSGRVSSSCNCTCPFPITNVKRWSWRFGCVSRLASFLGNCRTSPSKTPPYSFPGNATDYEYILEIQVSCRRGIAHMFLLLACVAFFFPQNLLTFLATQRQNCWGELSIILSTASESTKLKVILFIIRLCSRKSIIVFLLILSRTAFYISPVIFLTDTLPMITSCSSALLVDPFCFHPSPTKSFSVHPIRCLSVMYGLSVDLVSSRPDICLRD